MDEIVYRSLVGDIFIFRKMRIGEIAWKICEFIDRSLLQPEDMEEFVSQIYHTRPAYFNEMCRALNKGI